ncbi:MAG: hypothetical protein IMHGJWDQ_001596 [Candidatus Fervidibacter sp.]
MPCVKNSGGESKGTTGIVAAIVAAFETEFDGLWGMGHKEGLTKAFFPYNFPPNFGAHECLFAVATQARRNFLPRR